MVCIYIYIYVYVYIGLAEFLSSTEGTPFQGHMANPLASEPGACALL